MKRKEERRILWKKKNIDRSSTIWWLNFMMDEFDDIFVNVECIFSSDFHCKYFYILFFFSLSKLSSILSHHNILYTIFNLFYFLFVIVEFWYHFSLISWYFYLIFIFIFSILGTWLTLAWRAHKCLLCNAYSSVFVFNRIIIISWKNKKMSDMTNIFCFFLVSN